MVQLKVHNSYRDVVAICDTDLVGNVFEEGKFQLEVKENFYFGEEVDKGRLLLRIKELSSEDATFNIIGEKSIGIALNSGLIGKDTSKTIQGIPFSMVLL